jgi:NAD(P)-dependent dehydrogenase (short-subunit alcohol dehydrogenase family)
VSTASARARGKLADLDRADLLRSFDTKVIGPTMLAKYFGPVMAPDGSFVIFSGVNAFKVNVGYLGVAITNGAADFLTRSLAVELGPIRVNAISPGVIDTGIWDSLGPGGKADSFAHLRMHNPVRRIGTVDDIANAALFAMTNTFLTGVTLKVDGGEPLTRRSRSAVIASGDADASGRVEAEGQPLQLLVAGGRAHRRAGFGWPGVI